MQSSLSLLEEVKVFLIVKEQPVSHLKMQVEYVIWPS